MQQLATLLHRQEQSFYSALTDGGLLTLGLEERSPSDVEQVWQTFLASKAFGKSALACLPFCQRYLIGCQGCCMKKIQPNTWKLVWSRSGGRNVKGPVQECACLPLNHHLLCLEYINR